MSVEYWLGRPSPEYRVTTCGECKATQTMRESIVCIECRMAELKKRTLESQTHWPTGHEFDGADGF